MRQRSAAALLVSILITSVPGAGIAGPPRPVTFRGSVATPGVAPAAFEAARCSWITNRTVSQGVIGHMIQLPARVYDYRTFTVRAVNQPLIERTYPGARAEGPTFDIAFYDATIGTCTSLEQPLGVFRGTASRTVGYIPGGARYALVVRSDVDALSLPWSPCYAMPPICLRPSFGATVRASSNPGPEPFTFVIAAI